MRIPAPIVGVAFAALLVLALGAQQVVRPVAPDCNCGVNPSRLRTYTTTIAVPPIPGTFTTPLVVPATGNGFVVTSVGLSIDAINLSPHLILDGQKLFALSCTPSSGFLTTVEGGLRVNVGSTLAIEMNTGAGGTATATVLGYVW